LAIDFTYLPVTIVSELEENHMAGRRYSSGGYYTDADAKTVGVKMTADEIAAIRAITSKPLGKAVREFALASIGFKRSEPPQAG
jgi:hypothetical protein